MGNKTSNIRDHTGPERAVWVGQMGEDPLQGAVAARRREDLGIEDGQRFIDPNHAVEAPQAAPVQPQQPNVAGQPAPIPASPVGGEQQIDPASFTGQETDEQLASMGYTSVGTQERIRRLAIERNEAQVRANEADQRLASIEQRLGMAPQFGGLPQQAQVPAENQQTQPSLEDLPIEDYAVAANDPFPEDGDFEEQQSWRQRERAYEFNERRTMQHMLRMGQVMQNAIMPVVHSHVTQQRETQWAEIDPVVKAAGTSRAEIQPLVDQILQRQPDRSVSDAVYQAMGMAGVNIGEVITSARSAAPQPTPVVTTPGQGRTAPVGHVQNPATQFQPASQSVSTGDPDDALASLFKARRESSGIANPYQRRPA